MDSCGPLLATHFLLEKQVEARAHPGKSRNFVFKMIRCHWVPAHDGTSLYLNSETWPPFPLGGLFFAPAFTRERVRITYPNPAPLRV
jgi:hypothetical protein